MSRTHKIDFVYSEDGKEMLLEGDHKKAKEDLIKQYKSCRKALGMSQAKLASLTGIAQPNIARFESGNYNPTLEMMVRLAKAMGKEIVITLK